MSDDLVKRLRKNVMCGDAVIEEAADRIEKLEAALRDLCDGWECCPVSQAMRRVARKALDAE
jgi:hypothetical protein